MSHEKRIRVLIVDDSASVRQTIKDIVMETSDIEVMALAPDPYVAAEKIAAEVPDVMILDIEMPKMDGLTFLHEVMTQHPIPTIICSSLASEGSDSIERAWAYGAVDVITKPKLATRQFLEESSILICDAIRAAAHVPQSKLQMSTELKTTPKLNADSVIALKKRHLTETTEKVIVVGASTGGTEALREFLVAMPEDAPGIIIVQHMPENFTKAFAKRLDAMCKISVKEAQDGDSVLRGLALIAPGNLHTLLKRSGAQYKIEVRDGPLVTRHRPSVDVLFRSAAISAGKNAIGIIMTGMGDDGAKGTKELHDSGAFTIAQDEASCVVFGMPKEAIKAGGVDVILPLHLIATRAYSQGRSD